MFCLWVWDFTFCLSVFRLVPSARSVPSSPSIHPSIQIISCTAFWDFELKQVSTGWDANQMQFEQLSFHPILVFIKLGPWSHNMSWLKAVSGNLFLGITIRLTCQTQSTDGRGKKRNHKLFRSSGEKWLSIEITLRCKMGSSNRQGAKLVRTVTDSKNKTYHIPWKFNEPQGDVSRSTALVCIG